MTWSAELFTVNSLVNGEKEPGVLLTHITNKANAFEAITLPKTNQIDHGQSFSMN